MRRALTFAVSLVPILPLAGRAQQPSVRFRIHPWTDGVVVAAGLSAALVPMIWPGSFPHATCAPCDPATLWSVDRGTVGPARSGPATLSNGTLGLEALLGAAFLASSRKGEAFAAFAEDATVIAQALTTTAAVTSWTKVLFHRPRPFLYAPTATGPVAPEDGRSMPSEHSSIAFAAAAAYASVLHRRGIAGNHKLQIGALFTAAAATATLRVVARRHFPTDVVAGAALGFVIGWTVPAIHPVVP